MKQDIEFIVMTYQQITKKARHALHGLAVAATVVTSPAALAETNGTAQKPTPLGDMPERQFRITKKCLEDFQHEIDTWRAAAIQFSHKGPASAFAISQDCEFFGLKLNYPDMDSARDGAITNCEGAARKDGAPQVCNVFLKSYVQ